MFSENVLQNTPNCTANKQSWEYGRYTPKYSSQQNSIYCFYIKR